MPTSPGHGALILMEMLPDSAPGIFTAIAELNHDIKFGMNRPVSSNLAPHNRDIDEYELGSIVRDMLEGTLNWVFGEATHDKMLEFFKTNKKTGFKWQGPPDEDGNDTLEWILSGKVQMFSTTFPVREGAASTQYAIRPSGPMIVNGEPWGSNA